MKEGKIIKEMTDPSRDPQYRRTGELSVRQRKGNWNSSSPEGRRIWKLSILQPAPLRNPSEEKPVYQGHCPHWRQFYPDGLLHPASLGDRLHDLLHPGPLLRSSLRIHGPAFVRPCSLLRDRGLRRQPRPGSILVPTPSWPSPPGIAAGALLATVLGFIVLQTDGAPFALINLAFNQIGFWLVASGLQAYTRGEDGLNTTAGTVGFLDFSNEFFAFGFFLACLLLGLCFAQSFYPFALRDYRPLDQGK